MRLIIGEQVLDLLVSNPDYTSLPTGQADIYKLFLSLFQNSEGIKVEEIKVDENSLIEKLGFKSRLPLESRIEHLAARELLKVSPKPVLVAA